MNNPGWTCGDREMPQPCLAYLSDSETFTNDQAANQFLSREYRAGYELPTVCFGFSRATERATQGRSTAAASVK